MAATSVERGARRQQCQVATGAMNRRFSQAWTTVAVRRLVTRALVLLVLNVAATFAAAVEVVHPAPESVGDTRFEYYWQLLARALAVTEPDFGPYVLRSATSAMTERRALEELMTGSGKITVGSTSSPSPICR